MNNKFAEMGSYLIQIGLYFTTKENDNFEKNPIHNNIMGYLLQSYLYLLNYQKDFLLENNKISDDKKITEDVFLTKKEVIRNYYPLFTDYGLSQAIHTNSIPYHKRGSKYFFKKSEIDDWINNKDSNTSGISKNSHKFV